MSTRPHAGPHAGPHDGRATPAGTACFRKHFASLHPGFFRAALGRQLSSIGLGTYLSEADDENLGIASCPPLSAERFAALFV
jgi:hypothetical protein